MESSGRTPVIIVGGGLSGLAAAVDLAAAGVPVLLLEQKPAPGGRARSFVDAATGDEVDNGQHLLIAGYTHTLAFLERVGSRRLVDVQHRPVIPFHHPVRGFVDFRLPALPSPLHMLWGVLRTPLLSIRNRLALLRGGAALRLEHAESADGMTIAGWLDAHGQPEEVRRCFWEPLAVAIMNERIERAPARLFLDALRQAFLRHRRDAALVFPRAGLSRLFAEPACAFIAEHGGEVRCNADVVRIAIAGGLAKEVVLKSGETLRSPVLVLAVPPDRAGSLVPGIMGTPVGTQHAVSLQGSRPSPILSMHLWMNPDFMKQEVLGLIGRRIHWVFRKERHLSVVISAAYDFVDLSNEELVTIALEDLREVFGGSVPVPSHSVVIREKKATFLPRDGASSRPGPRTGVENLFLAGDWTDTGLPATIEGAILSGQAAAALALRSLQLKPELAIFD